MMLIDTHCHLDDERFDKDREDVIGRAFDAGVVRILVPGIDLESSRKAIEIAEKYSEVYAAVGVHPNSGLSWDANTLKDIRELAEHPKVMAIGEIGLDYYRDRTPRYVQEQIFHHQLNLAKECALPVIIHNRNATEDVIRMLSLWYERLSNGNSKLLNRPGVLHSYSGTIEETKSAIAKRFFLGFTGPVTFKNAHDLRAVAKSTDINNILIETDAPYLSPHPFRGKRNEPMQVKLVAEKLSEVLGLTMERFIQVTYDNAQRLFQW